MFIVYNRCYYNHYFPYCHTHSITRHLVQMIIWINISVHQWAHPSAGTLSHCAAVFVFKCSTGVSFSGFCRGQPMTWDQCMADRGQIDLTSVFLSLPAARCLSRLAWRDSGKRAVVCVCVLSIRGSTKHRPWLRQTEVDRLYWTICHRPGRGEKDGSEETEGCILMVSLWNKQLDGGTSGMGCHWELT